MRLRASRYFPDAIVGHQRQRAVDIVPVPRRQKPIHKCVVVAPFRLLSISRKQSARYCAGPEKLAHSLRYSFRLFQQQKVPGAR
jgi:hypothetical protein